MKHYSFFLTYFLIAVLQILICNYLNLSSYVMLTVLPALILFIPITYGNVFAMILAFVTGLAVDYMAEGIVGLNALALVPVAFCRRGIIRLVFGNEIFARRENISLEQHGILKVSIAIIIAHSLFMLIYVTADGASMRPFWFNLTRFLMSVIVGWMISLPVSESLATDGRGK